MKENISVSKEYLILQQICHIFRTYLKIVLEIFFGIWKLF